MRGQAVILIALVIVLAALALAVVFRVFAMAPAYVYQRSIYYVFKYNPLLVTQGLTLSMNTAVDSFAMNFSRFMLNYGIAMYLHVLAGWTPLPTSLLSMLQQEFNLIINTAYAPTGLAVPVKQPNFNMSMFTDFYGALGVPGLSMIYTGGNGSGIYVGINQTFNMPTLGIYNLTLVSSLNLTGVLIKPSSSTCNAQPILTQYTATYYCTYNFTLNSPSAYRYICIGPGFNKTGGTNSAWAYLTSGSRVYGAVLLYPVDELDASGGFRISALFGITNPSSFNIALSFLDPYPPSNAFSLTGYSIACSPSSISSNKITLQCNVYAGSNLITSPSVKLSLPLNAINVTIQVRSISGGPFSSNPTATANFYINGSLLGSLTISLPSWHSVFSSTFNEYAYELYGLDSYTNSPLGSWVTVLNLTSSRIMQVTVRLRQNYTLIVNPIIAVSLNNAPALGSTLSLAYVKPGVGLRTLNISYVTCNITSNAIMYEVNLSNVNPSIIGYPYSQLLILVNYSGISLVINPWNPSALRIYGVKYGGYVPRGYSSTSMVGYYIQVYNTVTGSLTNIAYLWNGGVPTVLTIYEGTSVMINYGFLTTIYLVNVYPSLNVNIYPSIVSSLKLYSFNEAIYNVPSGYLALDETAPSSNLNPYLIISFKYLPSQTLPITYINTTITNCGNNFALLLYYTPGVGYVYYGNGGGQLC
ncbi:MAG: hypothetical protein ACP5L1_03745 [Caldivirga sp.]|uniref:hypothetical protein n=1 Tax=Caldivirga sp. TaxID=2080243 RepID=UPI003D1093E2